MKIMYDRIEPLINVSRYRPYIIVIENSFVLRKFIQDLMQEEIMSGKFIFSNNDKEIKFSKEVEFVLSPFMLDFNKKKIINKILAEVENSTNNPNMYEETNYIKTALHDYLLTLFSDIDYPVIYNEGNIIPKLISALGITIDTENNILLAILQYIDLCNKLLGKNIFIFYGLNELFSDSELELLYKDISYKQVFFIQLESHKRDVNSLYDLLLIDKDQCVIESPD